MRSFQSKVLERMERIAASVSEDIEVVDVPNWANTGKVVAMDGFLALAEAHYRFNSGHNVITFNEGALGSLDGFLFAETDADKIAAMLGRWQTLLNRAYDSGC